VQQIMAEVRKTNRVAGKEDDIELASFSEALANAVVQAASVIQTKESSAVLCVTISVDC